uniref:Uncharacterized protein n=1 Tax=Chrysemys picta bellii TaxID=8478 RepID=A0A8C3IN46_CHRPI
MSQVPRPGTSAPQLCPTFCSVFSELNDPLSTPQKTHLKTTTPLSTSITTPATIHFFLSFRIVNWNFNNSLLDPSTSYYKDLYSKIQSMVSTAAPPSPPGPLPLPASWGRLPAPGWGAPRGPLCSLPDPTVTGSPPFRVPLAPGVPLSPPDPPAWIVSLCRRRNRGELDLFSSQASYQPTSEYPTYHTYGRFSSPGKKQDPYNDVSSGIAAAGTNAFYANPAMSS